MSPTQTRSRQPARRKPKRRAQPFGWPARIALGGAAIALGLLAAGALARRLVHTSNSSRDRFDAVIVLGYPATSDGDPSPRELASINEAVRDYERGAAPHLIFTGAAVANPYVEAEVMARAAEAQGIPAEAALTETHARNTVENACFAVRMMKAHGWHSAEVIANPTHLPRAAMIFSRMPIEWQLRVAPRVEPESAQWAMIEALWEDTKAAHYLVWTRWVDPCEP